MLSLSNIYANTTNCCSLCPVLGGQDMLSYSCVHLFECVSYCMCSNSGAASFEGQSRQCSLWRLQLPSLSMEYPDLFFCHLFNYIWLYSAAVLHFCLNCSINQSKLRKDFNTFTLHPLNWLHIKQIGHKRYI